MLKTYPANKLVTAIYGITTIDRNNKPSVLNPSATKKGPGRKHQQGKGKF